MEISTSPKTYWSVLNSFHNNEKNILYCTNFTRKWICYKFFFAKQCSTIESGGEVPSFLHPKADKSLSNIAFTEKDIEKVKENLDSNKVHGHDMINIRMLKICVKSIITPLLIIYKKSLEEGCFPNEWKKANVFPVHKKVFTTN